MKVSQSIWVICNHLQLLTLLQQINFNTHYMGGGSAPETALQEEQTKTAFSKISILWKCFLKF